MIASPQLNARTEFSAVHLDVRSMKNKRDCRNLFFESLKVNFDAILFTETWFNTNDDHVPHPGYKYNDLVRSSGRGGGVAVYVKCCYPHSVINIFRS